MLVKDAIELEKKKLATNSCLEARILLSHVLGASLESLLMNYYLSISDDKYSEFVSLIERRVNSEPIAYILGYKEFFGRRFFVNEGVLIPRQDSETLIEAVLNSDVNPESKILDLGIGSGCILTTLLCELPSSKGIGIDISHISLCTSKLNADAHGVASRTRFLHGDWFEPLDVKEFDVIVSNPPYISEFEKDLVSKETILYEPKNALFAGLNGLEHFYKIAQNAKFFLKENGSLYLEIGFNQLDAVVEIFQESGYKFINSYKDLSGYDRSLSFLYEKRL